jgi:hypothetical protein
MVESNRGNAFDKSTAPILEPVDVVALTDWDSDDTSSDDESNTSDTESENY